VPDCCFCFRARARARARARFSLYKHGHENENESNNRARARAGARARKELSFVRYSSINAAMNKESSLPLLTVSQLTNAIKMSLESMFPSIYLQGEITNFKVQTSGHLYFSLKDANAQIAAVMFAREASYLKTMPKAGDQVVIKGEINVYPPKGNYQLLVRELSFVGLGELLQRLEQLKVKLHQMGWFKAARKKPLPRYPKRIGVITSPTGAVIQDIINVLSRRFSGFSLLLNPVKVQGEGAAKEIAQAIEQFNRYQLVDVMIVGRGGGSLEDLWAFNEEIVAEAIYNSQIPIISAVGHETDHCIADYVADVRAPTPSAAAEIVIAEKAQQIEQLSLIKKRMQQTLIHLINQNRLRLNGLAPWYEIGFLIASSIPSPFLVRTCKITGQLESLIPSKASTNFLTSCPSIGPI